MNNFFFLNNIKLRDASMTSKVQIISFPLLQSNYPKKKNSYSGWTWAQWTD